MSDGKEAHVPSPHGASSGERHSHDLKKVNDKLRELIESLRTDRERHHAGRSPAASANPARIAKPFVPDAAHRDQPGEDHDRLSSEVARLRREADEQRRELNEVRERLAETEQENRRIYDEAQAVQEQTAAIANLYAALYRLNTTLDRTEVLTAVQEIVINMIGSEELAVFERTAGGKFLELIRSYGVEAERMKRVELGVGPIGVAAASGEIFVSESEGQGRREGELSACVPLKIGGEVTGAVAIFRLLGQKAGITNADRQLFEVLQEQAARALYLTKLHEDRAKPGPG